MAKEAKVSKGTISKKVKQLTREKLINVPFRSSFKALELTAAGKRALKEMQQMLRVLGDATFNRDFPLTFRWHNLQFRIPILKTDPEVNKQLEAAGFTYGKKRAFVRGWEIIIDGTAVFYSTRSFQIFPKPIAAGNLNIAVQKGCWLIAGIIEKLKGWFPYLELGVKAELCRQHMAMIGGITVKIPDGFKYKSDTLIVDSSTGVAEIESISSKYAEEHMREICAFLDDIGNKEMVT